jgi:cytochrome b561
MSHVKKVKVYSAGSKLLHWVIGLLILMMLSASFFLEDLKVDIKPFAIRLHMSFGITVLALMILRVYWLHRSGRPPLPKSVPLWEVIVARTIQYAMYALLIAMPIVGWIMSVLSNHTPSFFGLFYLHIPGLTPNSDLANQFFLAHQIIAYTLIGLITLHILGALKHAVVDKDKILQRMLPE